MANAILDARRQKRAAKQTELDTLTALIATEQREPTPEEAEQFEKLAIGIDKDDKKIATMTAMDTRAETAAKATTTVPALPQGESVIGYEPGVYRRDGAIRYGEPSYMVDLASVSLSRSSLGVGEQHLTHPDDALKRMQRNWKELQVDAEQGPQKRLAHRIVDEVRRWSAVPDMEARVNPNTTAGTGGEFVPPLWLVSQYAQMARPGRVIANRIPSHPLPPGIDIINLPKIKVGSSTAIQAAQANAVSSTDIQTSTISASVNTIAGQEDISMQLLEQSPLSMDGVIFDDLSRDYDQRLDIQCISGSGSSGQHKGALSITQATANTTTVFNTDVTKANQVTCASTIFWDGTSATSFTQYRSIVNGVTNIEILRFASPTAIWAHPRRVNAWALASDAATGRPLFVASQNGQYNTLGTQEANPTTQGAAGVLYGLPVIKDANMPVLCVTGALSGGTGDAIGIVKEDDMLLWEGTMRMRALPEILSGTLQIRFQVYAYSAFMPDRFAAGVSIITGTTGLAAPSW